MFKLSPRLQLIYYHLIPGKPVWDLCCDHGYLGFNAYESGNFPAIYFVDRVPSIMEQLKRRFEEHQDPSDMPSTQALFIPQAAEDLEGPLCGNVVIAGVGALTTQKILSRLSKRGNLRAERLLLCPQGADEKLSQVLCEISGFAYELSPDERKTIERGRVRKLLILNRK